MVMFDYQRKVKALPTGVCTPIVLSHRQRSISFYRNHLFVNSLTVHHHTWQAANSYIDSIWIVIEKRTTLALRSPVAWMHATTRLGTIFFISRVYSPVHLTS